MGIHIGTSGWSYDHWQGVLYPPKTATGKRLGYYLQQFQTVELNSSFYRWPKPETFAGWQAKLPEGFLLSAKAPRWLTYVKNLKEPEPWIERIEEGWSALADKQAILLVQLSPRFACNYNRLAYFLDRLPRWIRVAVEFRHATWHTEAIFNLLEEQNAAYCIMSGAGLPCILRTSASLVYVRLHGPEHQPLYHGAYSEGELNEWAGHLRAWAASGKDVYVYFNNDIGGHAVRNALALRALTGA
ncbi:DUF72 domain-containing protein [Spirosoma taeanense]|uniref:DUF72 domain-containing protein n=1 Tax=Spirosoma taeanense TaxID=2735870 RepID=A0A6M5YCH9_9BACT|nr:DUF72 domain-containing protein [Spirosoma taeanense]QJW91765.1 DUF72 domain-containing protein [Spirosoma taeanense]